MDVKFLRTISEGYITKNRLDDTLNADDLFEDLYSLVKELREHDIELYHKLYDTGMIHKTRIIESYLEMQYGKDMDNLNEGIIALSAISMGASAIFVLLYRNKLTKKVVEIGKNIGGVLEKAGKYLSTTGRYWSFRYAIIQQNVSKCYRGCGVNEKDITMWHYMATRDDVKIGTKDSIEQGQCLSLCYIDHMIDVIALLSKSYFVCLKKTGDFQQVQNATPDSLLNMLSGLQMSASCKEYFNQMKETFDKFYTLLDYVYGKNEAKKNRHIGQLRKKLIDSRKFIAKSNNMKQFK